MKPIFVVALVILALAPALAQSPAPAKETQFFSIDIKTIPYLSPYSVSADGKRLLWLRMTKQGLRWVSRRVDGSGQVEWPANAGAFKSSVVWLRDNRHWVELVRGDDGASSQYTGALIYDIDPKISPREVSINDDESGEVKGVTAMGDIVLVDYHRPGNSTVTVRLLNLSKVNATSHKYVLTPDPALGEVEDAVLSPSGNRLAWIFRVQSQSQLAEVGGRQAISSRYAIFVSNLDGTDLHEISSMPGEYSGSVDNPLYFSPTSLSWTPDGKHISFIFKKALCTVPVP